jgi:hypothetical protein
MRSVLFLVPVLVLGCDKASGSLPAPGASASATAAMISSAATGATAKASDAALPLADAGGSVSAKERSYVGEYKAQAVKMFVPEEEAFKGFKFRGEESSEGVGPGTLELQVGAGGRVEGSGLGTFGAFLVSGLVVDKMLTAQIFRKSKDGGFSGYLEATENAEGFAGTMHVSLGNGNVLREATFALKKK